MQVIDLHCDVLLKLQEGKGQLSFTDSENLSVNLDRLKAGKVKVQAFAIYIAPTVPAEEKYAAALEQIKYFEKEVVGKHSEMKAIKKWQDIHTLKENEIGAFLTLEGVEPIGYDLRKLHHLLDLGVLSVGLTWNPANLAADGIMEKRGAGLSQFGYDIVAILNERKILTDVSHISVKGFWDVLETAKYPIATHSNAQGLCKHVRNLSDAQIKGLIQKNGMIHMVFNPPFIKNKGIATIEDLTAHIQYICDLGGKKHIGFGSDFDGIQSHVENLTHAGEIPQLIDYLNMQFTEKEVANFAWGNFLHHLPI